MRNREIINEFMRLLSDRNGDSVFSDDANAKFRKFVIKEFLKTLSAQEEKLSKEMADAIEMSKQGWIDEGRLELKQTLISMIEGMEEYLTDYHRKRQFDSSAELDGYFKALSDLKNKVEKEL
ncbi:MAG TPA: hypothetical protein ENH85_05480 [Candidatus Scalindua sp.]|nr:hypothetical protein [Candidatus Scalindua sp.]